MRIRTTIATTAALLALTACSSDDGDSSTAESDASAPASKQDTKPKDDGKAALEDSVRTYTKALFGGDGPTGYRLLSARCKQEMSPAQFQTMADQGHNDYGSLEIKTISVDQISGDLARVSYGVGVPQFERKAQPWAREDGVWRWDAC